MWIGCCEHCSLPGGATLHEVDHAHGVRDRAHPPVVNSDRRAFTEAGPCVDLAYRSSTTRRVGRRAASRVSSYDALGPVSTGPSVGIELVPRGRVELDELRSASDSQDRTRDDGVRQADCMMNGTRRTS